MKIEKKITKQARYRMKMKAQGRCIACGKPAVNKNHCGYHANYNKKDSLEAYRTRRQSMGVLE